MLSTMPAGAADAAGPRAPKYLRCEYLVDPLAVDAARPRLTWEVDDPRRGAVQAAFQIRVASDAGRLPRPDLWDSGKVAAQGAARAEYAGPPLRSGQRCCWQVRTWDAGGRASPWSRTATWGMGLLRPQDWKARWIGDAAPADPVRPAHNGYHSELSSEAGSEKWVTVDLGASRSFDAVRLYPARPFDWQSDTPGFLYPLRFRVEASERPDLSDARVLVDRTAADEPSPGAEPQTYRFAPVAARYVRLLATRLRERDPGHFGVALAEMQVLSGETNLALRAPVTAGDSLESGAWAARNLTDGDVESHPASGAEPLTPPVLRRAFRLTGPARRATLYATALGLYEAHLNGGRVGDHILAPEWTSYHKRVQYQAYDVTKMLRPGDNVLGALLGDGWYAGRIGMSDGLFGRRRGVYGRRPQFRAQLVIELADGRTQTIATDGAWRSTTAGAIVTADIYDGEAVDARREVPGWDLPGYDDRTWKPVDVAPETTAALVAQPNEPIAVVAELKPVALTEPKPGVYIFDLGQNMVGRARMRLRGRPGEAVTLRHGEALNDDGTLYTANLRGAPQVDRYTPRSARPEVFEPRFTYHGFRYVEVTGLAARPAAGDLVGRVFCSSAPEVGRFECSDPLLNRLWQNIVWTQRANLMSVPTDCPQRDERLGWMGDIQVYSQTGIFAMDLAGFFTKWLRDVRDDQAADGRFPDFAPHPYDPDARFSGAPAWGDAGTVVPWRCWQNYGDRRVLSEQFEAARRWVDFVRAHNPDLVWRSARGNDYNDWLNADTLILDDWPKTGGTVPNDLFATAFFAHSADLVARMAHVLGEREQAARYGALADEIRAAFNRAFVQPDGRLVGDTQAGYALALHFDLLPEALRPAAAKHMVDGLDRYHGHLSTGIQSTVRAMLELTRWGYTEQAYRILLDRTYPSWLYSVDQGATTIWERWDGYVKGRGFQDPGMNSLNHWAFGAVGEWMQRVILGLNPDEQAPGWKRFTVRPLPGGGLTWARGEYRSIAGRIAAAWRQERGAFTLDLTVPPDTRATVCVPASDPARVSEGGLPAQTAAGVRFVRMADGAAVFEVGGGTYRFAAEPGGAGGQ